MFINSVMKESALVQNLSSLAQSVLSSRKTVKPCHLSQRAERIHALILQLITLVSETAPGKFVILSQPIPNATLR